MVSMKRAIRRIVVCLILALAFTVVAAPILRTDSSIVWAKKKKKTSKKKKKANKKKAAAKKTEGFAKRKGHWVFLENGKKKTGWFEVNGKRYFGIKKGSKKGRLARGWFKIGKKEFYFRDEGGAGVIGSLCVSCEAKVNGIMCIFDAAGKLVKCKYAGKRDSFENQVGELARMNQAKNNILASLVVAQACVETGFGGSIYRNNLFGIRAGSGYRSYSNWQESIDDYVSFMHRYIPRIFGVRDWQSACYIIGSAGYAEAGGYGSALASVVSSHNLTRFNR